MRGCVCWCGSVFKVALSVVWGVGGVEKWGRVSGWSLDT